TKPRIANTISIPIAQAILLIRVERISGIVKGVYSFITRGNVLFPERTDV
ncbi:unnamed protein product, partial [marine sediment metagenome]